MLYHSLNLRVDNSKTLLVSDGDPFDNNRETTDDDAVVEDRTDVDVCEPSLSDVAVDNDGEPSELDGRPWEDCPLRSRGHVKANCVHR